MSLASRFNLAYLSAGIYCEEQLKTSDAANCLKSMLQQNWRARTEEQACQLMKEFVDKWREATRLFTEYEYQFDDFGERLKCREAFILNVVRRFVPWELRGGKLYRPTASGGTIGCHKLIVPFLYQQKGVVLPAWDVLCRERRPEVWVAISLTRR